MKDAERRALLTEIIDDSILSEIRGGDWTGSLRTWWYEHGPKCGSPGFPKNLKFGTPAWLVAATTWARQNGKPLPPKKPCQQCSCAMG